VKACGPLKIILEAHMPIETLDPKDLERMEVGSLVVLRWYARDGGGYCHSGAEVLESVPGGAKLALYAYNGHKSKLTLTVNDEFHSLASPNGGLYDVILPDDNGKATIQKHKQLSEPAPKKTAPTAPTTPPDWRNEVAREYTLRSVMETPFDSYEAES